METVSTKADKAPQAVRTDPRRMDKAVKHSEEAFPQLGAASARLQEAQAILHKKSKAIHAISETSHKAPEKSSSPTCQFAVHSLEESARPEQPPSDDLFSTPPPSPVADHSANTRFDLMSRRITNDQDRQQDPARSPAATPTREQSQAMNGTAKSFDTPRTST